MAAKVPLVADERVRKRESLLTATERELQKIALAVARDRRPLRHKNAIALRVAKVANRYKMAKHFAIEIGDASFRFSRKEGQIAAEAALDGIYVLGRASRTTRSRAARSSPPTRRWRASSGPFGPSTPIWTSGRSATAPKRAWGRTSFWRCSPTASPSTWGGRSQRCWPKTMTRRWPSKPG